MQLDRAVDAYNGATVRLEEIEIGRIGIALPHHAASQYGYGRPVARSQLVPGDVVFFNGLGHNGIYVGGGRFVHSPHTGDVVKISSLYDSWYASTYVGAQRL
jgi:cell wall-associated NlpC family hydrolase